MQFERKFDAPAICRENPNNAQDYYLFHFTSY